MARVLLVVAAALVALLAFVLGRPWLYAAAAVPLALALGLIAWRGWLRYQSHQRRHSEGPSGMSSPQGTSREDESLEDLGIMEVRQQERKGEEESDAGETEASASPADGPPARNGTAGEPTPADRKPGDATSGSETSREGTTGEETSGEETTGEETRGDEQAESEPRSGAEEADGSAAPDEDAAGSNASRFAPGGAATEDAPALAPLMESLRAAQDTHTACYLVQEDVVPAYRIRALASDDPSARTTGTFETAGPLLTATMSNQPVTLRQLEGEQAVADYLGYYESSPDIDHVALAPIRRPDDPHTHFLLVDAGPDTDLGTRHAQDILKSYANTLRFLLEGGIGEAAAADGVSVEDMFAGTGTTSASEAAAAEAADEEIRQQGGATGSSGEGSSDGPRPRSEIVQEEMDAADAQEEDLALALVHLNRAESIARNGEDAVASAEKLLKARLEENAPGFRVARFGELTYGIFVRGNVEDIEAWASDLQAVFDRSTGRLEGGVSIGVAVRTVHNDDPVELRADATEALRQAYQTGACTIVE